MLAATIGPQGESFPIKSARILDGVARLYSSELSYSYCLGLHHLSQLWEPILPGLDTTHASWPSPKSAHRLVDEPLALGHHNLTVCSLACRWRLRSALQANGESFLFENHPLCLIALSHISEFSNCFCNKYFTL